MNNQNLFIRAVVLLIAVVAFCGCDEDTSSLGVYPDADGIVNSHDVFEVYSRSMAMDSVLSNSTTCFLGSINDPETKTEITANFAAQFHVFEDYQLPSKHLMFPVNDRENLSREVRCDSAEIRLYFENYYGEKNNPMKLEVYPLDTKNLMEEDREYYTNTDLSSFVVPNAAPMATKVFTPADYILSDGDRNSSTHSDNVRVMLSADYGTKIMNLFYEHPEYFKDSYAFIRNVCPGLFFKIKSGSGTMLNVDVSTMNFFFKYYDKEKADTTYAGICRFTATPEVIQSTQFNNDDLHELVNDKSCTYLKTPAGICTELILPVSEIHKGHESDSISKAKLTLTRYNNNVNSEFSLGIPESILMVRKKDMFSFFHDRKVANNQTSFTTGYDATYNAYTFQNIGRLISYCQNEKKAGMKEEGITETEWEAANPDWNRVVLIPVKVSTTSDSYGNSYQVSVNHDMDMNSIRLVGGANTPIKMQVIYSKFN